VEGGDVTYFKFLSLFSPRGRGWGKSR